MEASGRPASVSGFSSHHCLEQDRFRWQSAPRSRETATAFATVLVTRSRHVEFSYLATSVVPLVETFFRGLRALVETFFVVPPVETSSVLRWSRSCRCLRCRSFDACSEPVARFPRRGRAIRQ